jgi:hypothetical protein
MNPKYNGLYRSNAPMDCTETSDDGSRRLRRQSLITHSNNEHTARSLDGMGSFVPLSAFAIDISPKLQAASASTCFASPISLPRFVTALGRSLGVLHLVSTTVPSPFLASVFRPAAAGHLGDLRDEFQHHDVAFRVAFCRIFGLLSPRILSTFRSPTACASCHLSFHAM